MALPGDEGAGEQGARGIRVDHAREVLAGDHGTQSNSFTHVMAGGDAVVAGRDIHVQELHVHGGSAGGEAASGPAATPDEFRSDVLALLGAVNDWACRSGLPPHLVPGSDMLRMARTVRLLGRVRYPRDRPRGLGSASSRARVYALPTERDERAEEPPEPWEQVAARHGRLVVLGDPGMGKSWLLRLEARRLASESAAALERSAAVGEVAVPVPVRADMLAAAPGRTLGEAAAGYLVREGLLAARSEGLMRDLIARGGAVLLVDALDEVPREAANAGRQAPGKRLEDLLGRWAERCPGQARVVVTSRLAGYSGPPVPGAREAELLPFTAADIDAAVQAWDLPAQAAVRLLGRLRDPAVAGMARVPLLLALICSLVADPHGRRLDLPQTRAGLYEAVVWQFLAGAHRAADQGAPAPALDQAGRHALLRALTHVAVAFADTSRGWIDRMPHDELLDALAGAGDALAGLGGSPAAVLGRLSGQAGVLVPAGNPAGGEQDYVFLHRTIAEYLVARHLRGLPARRRMAIIAEHQWFDPDWAEVIPMLGGMLAARRPPDEASALVAWFLAQRPDPLHYAFRTALRVLGEAPDPGQLLTSAQGRRLGRKASRLLRADATRDMVARTLAEASAWPRSVTAVLLTCLNDHDEGVRRAAAGVLAERDMPEATAALLACLTHRDGPVRSTAAGALAERDAPEVTTALLACLDDHVPFVRSAAAGALAGRGAPEVTAALLACLNNQGGPARYQVAGALAGRDAPEVTAALLACLDDQDGSVRSAAAFALAGRDAPEVTAALLACLDDQDRLVRYQAAGALAGPVAPEVTAALLACLDDQDGSVRSAAASALAGRDAPEVTTALLACLTSQDVSIRSAATWALARRDTPEVTTGLLACLTSHDPRLRAMAAHVLASRDTPDGVAVLLARLGGEDPYAHSARRDAPEITAALLACLDDQDRFVRHQAARALARQDRPEVTAALLARLTDHVRGARSASVAAALRERDTPEVTAALLACLDDQDQYVRSAAAGALEGQNTPEVTAALLACLDDQDQYVRSAAAWALAGRDGPGVALALLARLDDHNQTVRNVVRHVLERRDEAAILLAVTRPGIWLVSPSRLEARFDLAVSTADRAYRNVSPSHRPRLRRRLSHITKRA